MARISRSERVASRPHGTNRGAARGPLFEGRVDIRFLLALGRLTRSDRTYATRVATHSSRASRPCHGASSGYGLQCALAPEGIACEVIAPSRTPETRGKRVKTDRRDAALLAHFLRSGDLVSVRVPEENLEALRVLLLAHGRIWPKPTAWSQAHLRWIEKQHFDHPALEKTLAESLQTVREPTSRLERCDARQAR